MNNIEYRRSLMSKTITIRIDEATYTLFKKAANGDRRTISNFIEYATLAYITEESVISDSEMEDILQNDSLLEELSVAENDIKSGNYRIVE
jgi:uncharacterized protein (DUF1778 family)